MEIDWLKKTKVEIDESIGFIVNEAGGLGYNNAKRTELSDRISVLCKFYAGVEKELLAVLEAAAKKGAGTLEEYVEISEKRYHGGSGGDGLIFYNGLHHLQEKAHNYMLIKSRDFFRNCFRKIKSIK
ncbi:MAG: hypothetical protein NTW17_02110 [Candidatus Pacearchaeota archaeon]|nr:hypothetical protein [Candidatus Pacearchaeota archaeon]